MAIHTRKCRDCGNVAEHSDNVVPEVLCKKCGSQDTRLLRQPLSRGQMLEKMKRDSRRIIAELEQMIRDIEWWNRHRADCDPLDCEGERLLLAEAKKDLECLERGDTVQAAKHSAEMVRIAEESEKFGAECL